MTQEELPSMKDCFDAAIVRMEKLRPEYDQHSYQLGFHAAYHWVLSEIFKRSETEETEIS